MLRPSSLPIQLLDSAEDSQNPPAPVNNLACARWWGSSVSRSTMHPFSKDGNSSPISRKLEKVFDHPHCAIICPSTNGQGQLWVHYSLDIGRSLHHRAGGVEVDRLLIRRSWKHPRELFRPPPRTIPLAISIANSSEPT